MMNSTLPVGYFLLLCCVVLMSLYACIGYNIHHIGAIYIQLGVWALVVVVSGVLLLLLWTTWQIYVLSADPKGKRNRKFIYIIFALSIGILCAWLGIILLISNADTHVHTHTHAETVAVTGTRPAVWIISLSRIQLYNELNLFCEPRRIIVQLNYVYGGDRHFCVVPSSACCSHCCCCLWLLLLLSCCVFVAVFAVSLQKDVPCRLWEISGFFVCRINDLCARNCQWNAAQFAAPLHHRWLLTLNWSSHKDHPS